ncbi:MAG: prepilin-type N-terminal cleavage/methylation domain-containing protein [Candidatus Riflebacteria bacterium]|nr:prepilin-type N-terminal cleavage/methylation domain-containing protein [Candidatus Riflebacteria bacterium]
MKNSNSKNFGFSLLEMVIVVAIIATMVALTAPFYADYINQSKWATMRANLRTLKKALNDYKTDKGIYPLSLSDLTKENGKNPAYLLDVPIDPRPLATTDWGYHQGSDPATYSLDSSYYSVSQ